MGGPPDACPCTSQVPHPCEAPGNWPPPPDGKRALVQPDSHQGVSARLQPGWGLSPDPQGPLPLPRGEGCALPMSQANGLLGAHPPPHHHTTQKPKSPSYNRQRRNRGLGHRSPNPIPRLATKCSGLPEIRGQLSMNLSPEPGAGRTPGPHWTLVQLGRGNGGNDGVRSPAGPLATSPQTKELGWSEPLLGSPSTPWGLQLALPASGSACLSPMGSPGDRNWSFRVSHLGVHTPRCMPGTEAPVRESRAEDIHGGRAAGQAISGSLGTVLSGKFGNTSRRVGTFRVFSFLPDPPHP